MVVWAGVFSKALSWDCRDWTVLSTSGVGSTGFLTYEAIVTPNEVTEQPYDISFTAGFTAPPSVFANMATIHGTDPSQMRLTGLPTTMGATMFIEEETCTDAEMTHTWAETVHVLAIEQSTRGCGGRLAMVRGTLAFTCDNGINKPLIQT